MAYDFMNIELEDWQVKSFRLKGQNNKEIVNEALSNSYFKESLLIQEKDVYTLTLQGLTPKKMKELYQKARTYTQNGLTFIFYGVGPDDGFSYNKTIDMNYIGEQEHGFISEIDYKKINISLKGVLYEMSFEVSEVR